MTKAPLAFIACAVPFFVLDAAWLTWAGPNLYRPAIGHLMAPEFSLGTAALFYVVYMAGLVGFCVLPSNDARSGALRGAGFGFVAYATYDLTNQATMTGWPWHVTVIDLAWGTCATAAACAVASAIVNRSRRKAA